MGYKTYTHHSFMVTPLLSLGLTALSLLLLVLVLLSVPGPIKGLYWFSIDDQTSDNGPLSAGVLGWCVQNTSNCTYAPLSNNPYLSTLIDVGEALTVRIALPLACYWMILTISLWIILSILVNFGYKIRDLDSISRHLRFTIVESCVLCVSIFGNVLCWLAFGLGRTAFLSIKNRGGNPKSGHAMETTAVAAMISLFSLFSAVWSLHLRVRKAQSQWREQAIMVRRRSLALSQAGAKELAISLGGTIDDSKTDNMGIRRSSKIDVNSTKRYTQSPEPYSVAVGDGRLASRGSMSKSIYGYEVEGGAQHPVGLDEEEILDRELERAKRNSRDAALGRRSSLLHGDSPYAAAIVPSAGVTHEDTSQ